MGEGLWGRGERTRKLEAISELSLDTWYTVCADSPVSKVKPLRQKQGLFQWFFLCSWPHTKWNIKNSTIFKKYGL